VQTIRLPEHHLSDAELSALNERLSKGEISLDWSAVAAEISPAQLRILFNGLNLSDHIELIGSETMPEALQMLTTQVFAELPTPEPSSPNNHSISASNGSLPPLWLPEQETLVNGEEEEVPAAPPADGTKLLQAPTPSAMRAELEEMVVRDLLGPAGGENEEVTDFRVFDRYLVGILAPNKAQIPAEEMDTMGTIEEGSEEQGPAETDNSQKTSLSPSSMGLSFCVDLQATSLRVRALWGHYQWVESEEREARGKPVRVWKRTQRGGEVWEMPLHEGSLELWQPEPDEQPDVYIKGLVRRSSECWTVTLFLVNGQAMPKQRRDKAFLFQPKLIVEGQHGGPIFQRRPSELLYLYRDEDKALGMLYRRHIGFAVGHGVSVHAETLKDDPTCAIRLTTTFIPTYEVPRTEAPTASELPALSTLCLDMRELAMLEPHELSAKLQPLVTAYAAWIEEQERRVTDPLEELQGYRTTAEKAIEQCRATLGRIQAGMMLLASNEQAARAFAFMNRAMWLQRIHTLYAEQQRRQNACTLDEMDTLPNRSWRPFQLAFILLNLPALTDLHHPERSLDPSALADLLWFPTGGGKTEAYLGLTAYTLGIRRLQGTIADRSGQDGVAVIMRYTLRLLTLQQFQRAAALICACESIRRVDSATWGTTPFRLGLWVGQRSTPNTTSESAEAVKQDHGNYSGKTIGYGNPRQLTHCPWCGCEIAGGRDIRVDPYEKGRGRTFMYCSDLTGKCSFSLRQSPDEGLPVLVVDEEIYRLLPALLIATVDKFAQLPWKGETQMLFGQIDKCCERHGFRSPEIKDSDSHKAVGRLKSARSYAHELLRPPDLIIQDELHLISGPLGTLVGLYETVVDHLASWEVDGKQVRPKVIAATATIRQAGQQIQSLFSRTVNIFPPQGIDVEDNFFSRQRTPGPDMPGRRYLGICANGRRMKAAQIRVYLAFLAAAQVLYNKYGSEAADPWMTLVGYFNSVSELGSMRHMVDDDISNRIWRMDQRGLAKRTRPNVSELTSRVSSSDIPDVLSTLEKSFAAAGSPRPIDILLATNMISVGVDVKRLGLMVVAGQPKTTAEYIQATSRVGRSFPGLVCIVYNWTRPRDLSHYEQFEHYHATFYQQVEALSVTPFAPRALDRGLAALLTSIVRLSGGEFNKNDAAGLVTDDAATFAQAIDAIVRRAENVATLEAVERVRDDLTKLKAYWVQHAEQQASLGYKKQNDSKTLGLLKEPRRGKWEPFTCLNSLRNVEPTVHLLLDERGLGNAAHNADDEEEQEENE
jgi:hypothetical protein